MKWIQKFLKYCLPLIEESDGKISLGRVTFVILINLSVYFWLSDIILPATLLEILILMTAYNFGKDAVTKGKEVYTNYINSKRCCEKLDEVEKTKTE